jgi:predicted transposase YbfD/YdcC
MEMKTIAQIRSKRQIGDKTSEEVKTAAYYNKLVRGHWGIKNQLHWHLEKMLVWLKKGNAAENLLAIRKIALHHLFYIKKKMSLKKGDIEQH